MTETVKSKRQGKQQSEMFLLQNSNPTHTAIVLTFATMEISYKLLPNLQYPSDMTHLGQYLVPKLKKPKKYTEHVHQ